MKRENLWVVTVNTVIGISLLLALALCLNQMEWYLQLIAYLCVSAFTVGDVVAFARNRQTLVKSLFLFNLVALILIGILTAMNIGGIFEDLGDVEKIKELILKSGNWGYLIYAILTILNVTFLPVPATLMTLAGVAIFGAVKNFFLTYIGVMIGSVVAFLIGRLLGKKVVAWCVGEEAIEKYGNMIGKKGSVLFIIMQLLPFFPDDILCMVAGLTPMSFPFFFFSLLIVKPIFLATVCFLGTGSLIPFSGWGIPVWIAILVVIGVLFFLFCKYQNKIETWFAVHFKKK